MQTDPELTLKHADIFFATIANEGYNAKKNEIFIWLFYKKNINLRAFIFIEYNATLYQAHQCALIGANQRHGYMHTYC